MSAPLDPGTPTLGALLCGGASRRMGTDKALVELAGEPLFRRPARALAASCEAHVQIGGAPLPGLAWDVIPDHLEGAGPAAGIESALLAFPGAVVVVCGVDMPFVDSALLRRLLAGLSTGAKAVVPHHGGRWHPLASAWSPEALPFLGERLDGGHRALQGLLDELPATPLPAAELAAFGAPARLLHNVNAPADLEQARRWLEEDREGPGR